MGSVLLIFRNFLCCVWFILCLVYPMLPVSLDCLFFIAPLVYFNVYLIYVEILYSRTTYRNEEQLVDNYWPFVCYQNEMICFCRTCRNWKNNQNSSIIQPENRRNGSKMDTAPQLSWIGTQPSINLVSSKVKVNIHPKIVALHLETSGRIKTGYCSLQIPW